MVNKILSVDGSTLALPANVLAKVATDLTPTFATKAEAAAGGGSGGGVEFNVKAAPFYAKGDGSTDDTAAIQACFNAAMASPGNSVVIPAGDFIISSVGIDYSGSNWAVQAESGPPYGYPTPNVRGMGVRKTRLIQKAGSTGNLFTVSGKVGVQSGPANNNKATGATVSHMELVGTPGGGHALYVRAAVNYNFSDIWIQKAGKSGIYNAREYFVSGVDDEYMYALDYARIKSINNAEWGFECSGTNSIGGSLYAVECIGNGLGGFKLAPTNMSLYNCQAIGNGVGSITGRGLLAVRNTNSTSVNSGLTLVAFRSEGNSIVGGYEVEIRGGQGYSMLAPSFYPTQGAHCLGLGVINGGNNNYIQAFESLGGFYGISDSNFPGQKAIVLGGDARDTLILNPRIQYNGSVMTPDAAITDGGFRTSMPMNSNRVDDPKGYVKFMRHVAADAYPVASAGEIKFYTRLNASGKQEVAVQFSTGAAVVVATQP